MWVAHPPQGHPAAALPWVGAREAPMPPSWVLSQSICPPPVSLPTTARLASGHPLLGVVVGPCSLELLRQTGRVPGAMLLGNMAQGPSLSPEPPPGWGLALTGGPPGAQIPPAPTSPSPGRLLPSTLWTPAPQEAVKAERIHLLSTAACQASPAPFPGHGSWCTWEKH